MLGMCSKARLCNNERFFLIGSTPPSGATQHCDQGAKGGANDNGFKPVSVFFTRTGPTLPGEGVSQSERACAHARAKGSGIDSCHGVETKTRKCRGQRERENTWKATGGMLTGKVLHARCNDGNERLLAHCAEVSVRRRRRGARQDEGDRAKIDALIQVRGFATDGVDQCEVRRRRFHSHTPGAGRTGCCNGSGTSHREKHGVSKRCGLRLDRHNLEHAPQTSCWRNAIVWQKSSAAETLFTPPARRDTSEPCRPTTTSQSSTRHLCVPL